MKNTLNRIILSILVIALLAGVFPAACFAEESAKAYKTIQINVPFMSLGHKQFEWEFPYSDGFFTENETGFDFKLELAQASLGLAISAFRNDGEALPNQYETYLGAAGFKQITPFGYDQKPSADTLAGVLAYKQIDDFILIAAVPCGQGYQGEWGGNMYVGNGERHAGFDNGARIMEAQIIKFISDNKLSGNLRLWVTGFSRAAAVGNLTAADMKMSGRFENVYAYLFGVPRTTRKPEYLEGIYNICGTYDPVPTVPLESWGFARYGVDCFTPAEETDSQYHELLKNASEVFYKISGSPMRNDPEINYQLHMIVEFVGEMFKTTEDYTEEFQDIMVKTMANKSMDHMLEALMTGLMQLQKLDSRQAYSSDVFADYLAYIVSQHTSKQNSHIEKGWWDPDLSLGENLMREHLPLTYLAWLFSGNVEHKLFFGPAFTRMVVVDADADVEVFYAGQLIGGAYRDGSVVYPREGRSICAIRNGSKTVLNIPMNDSFTIKLTTHGISNVIYYDITRTSHSTYGMSDVMHLFLAGKGEYSFDADYAEPLTDINVIDGKASNFRTLEYHYSTTVLMADDAGSSKHISVKTLVQIIFSAAAFTGVLILLCFILWLLHRSENKATGKVFSVLYIIVPHIVLIVLFAVLTQLFTINLFSIGQARAVFAGLTVLVMFLLALRGTLRNKNRYNVVVTVLLLILTFVNALVYQNSSLVSESLLHTVVYSVVMLILTILAVSTFSKRTAVKKS